MAGSQQWIRMIGVMGMAAMAAGQAHAKAAEESLTREERATRDAYTRLYSGDAREFSSERDRFIREAVAERQQQALEEQREAQVQRAGPE